MVASKTLLVRFVSTNDQLADLLTKPLSSPRYHFAIASNEIGNSLIAKSCNQTEFPDVCISTLESDPRSSNANLTDLSKIGFELTVTKSNETLAEAFKLLINASDYEEWARRSACYYEYNSSDSQIKVGLQYFDEMKYDEANRIVGLYNEGSTVWLSLGLNDVYELIGFVVSMAARTDNGELLIEKADELVSFDPESLNENILAIEAIDYTANSMESLVLLDGASISYDSMESLVLLDAASVSSE
uniref:Pectinesterase inhibitor domain-containing protein n=1 Tax=Fagus sylvatica TaxID=28930 RepID=A0A2N9GBY4_FAGSY